MSDPIRWLDDPELPEGLRSDLQHAVDHPPNPPLPPSPPTGLWPGWIALGAVALLAGGAWLLSGSPASIDAVDEQVNHEAPATRAQPTEHERAPVVVEAPVAEVAPVVEPPPVAEMAPALEAPALAESVGEVAAEGRAAPVEAAPTLEDEIASMAEIRRALASNPAEALRLGRRAERRFSSGIFGEERAAMIALSLHRLGRQDAAGRAATDFVRRFPTSTFGREMGEILRSGEGSPPSSH